jgi:hypothetical protein
MCPSNLYTGISRSIATGALARTNIPSVLRIRSNIGTKLHQPREPAEYVTVSCMDIGHRSLVVANAWVRGKSLPILRLTWILTGISVTESLEIHRLKRRSRMLLKLAYWVNFTPLE